MAETGTRNGVPCYAGGLVNAFRRYLAQDPAIAGQMTVPEYDVDARVPIALSHQMLEAAVALTSDPALGLKVARSLSAGDAGVAEYAMRSAPTIHDAILAGGRYMRLVNEAVDLNYTIEHDRAVLRWVSRVAAPRAAEDFLMAAIYTTHMRVVLHDAPDLEVSFSYTRPEDLSEHVLTFGDRATLRFAAAWPAYSFAADHLRQPITHGDARLHGILRQHAEVLLDRLPQSKSFTETVRKHLLADLSSGRPTAAALGKRLHMSARTLDRRLAEEGTSFGAVLDELRRRLSIEHLSRRDLSISEIAFLLGFSQAGAFHRAFKRWTGVTPLEYRRAAPGSRAS